MPCSKKSFLCVAAYLSMINKQPERRLLPKIFDEKYDPVVWAQGEDQGKYMALTYSLHRCTVYACAT